MGELLNGWLTTSSPYLVLLVPTLAFLESCVGIGAFISGVFLLTTSTVLYANDVSSLTAIVGLAFAGALAGDHLGYLVGRLLGYRVWHWQWLSSYQERTKRILRVFERSTPVSVCLGRLTPPLRSFTPLIAGVSGVTTTKFVLCDLLACTIWAGGLLLLVSGISTLSG